MGERIFTLLLQKQLPCNQLLSCLHLRKSLACGRLLPLILGVWLEWPVPVAIGTHQVTNGVSFPRQTCKQDY